MIGRVLLRPAVVRAAAQHNMRVYMCCMLCVHVYGGNLHGYVILVNVRVMRNRIYCSVVYSHDTKPDSERDMALDLIVLITTVCGILVGQQ